jgi:hypothetical protein
LSRETAIRVLGKGSCGGWCPSRPGSTLPRFRSRPNQHGRFRDEKRQRFDTALEIAKPAIDLPPPDVHLMLASVLAKH